MYRRRLFLTVGLVGIGAVLVGSVALATPVMNATAQTAIGPLVDRPLAVNWKFAPGTRVKLQTKGEVKVAFQRITIGEGGTLGWHTHPGPTVVTVFQNTLSFYHAEDCTEEIEYTPGQSFSNMPDEIHLARNEGAGDVVVFAVYFVPQSIETGPQLRIDQPAPGPSCPL